MKENISMATAVVAIIIAVIAVVTSFVVRPDVTIGEDEIGEFEIADGSVTSLKIFDSTIALVDLSTEVLAEMSGVVDIPNNTITSNKIAEGSITNIHISNSANIDPSKIFGTAWTATNDGSGSGLDADTLDGIDSTQFLRNDESGTLDGDLTVDGNITVDKVSYSSPRTHYYSVGDRQFQPTENLDFDITACGGIYLISGSGSLSAPVHLPDGAIVTSFTAFFRDTSDEYDITATLNVQELESCGYMNMAWLEGNSDAGYYNVTTSSINWNPIDNQKYSYVVGAYCEKWQSTIAFKGAVIAYTIAEAD